LFHRKRTVDIWNPWCRSTKEVWQHVAGWCSWCWAIARVGE